MDGIIFFVLFNDIRYDAHLDVIIHVLVTDARTLNLWYLQQHGLTREKWNDRATEICFSCGMLVTNTRMKKIMSDFTKKKKNATSYVPNLWFISKGTATTPAEAISPTALSDLWLNTWKRIVHFNASLFCYGIFKYLHKDGMRKYIMTTFTFLSSQPSHLRPENYTKLVSFPWLSLNVLFL